MGTGLLKKQHSIQSNRTLYVHFAAIQAETRRAFYSDSDFTVRVLPNQIGLFAF